jgi:hypothetical protein
MRPAKLWRWNEVACAAMAAIMLSGCAQDPDLGRYRPTALERVRAAFGDEEQSAALALTDSEAELRRMSANLMSPRPAPEKHRFWPVDMASGGTQVPANLDYYMRLRAQHPTSPDALVNALGDDIEADTVQMDLFSSICEQVVAADGERADDLLGHPANRAVVDLDGPGSFAAVRARLGENGRIIDATATVLAQRLVSYRTALAHARLDAPVHDRLDAIADAIRRMDDRLAAIDRSAVRHEAMEDALAGGASS